VTLTCASFYVYVTKKYTQDQTVLRGELDNLNERITKLQINNNKMNDLLGELRENVVTKEDLDLTKTQFNAQIVII
jgi:hypothetical protein